MLCRTGDPVLRPGSPFLGPLGRPRPSPLCKGGASARVGGRSSLPCRKGPRRGKRRACRRPPDGREPAAAPSDLWETES